MEREEKDNFSLLNQVSTVVFTLRDGLFDGFYFKCNYANAVQVNEHLIKHAPTITILITHRQRSLIPSL